MVSRIQNRNNGYSENLFSHNPRKDNNTLNSIDGATALKLDESYELKKIITTHFNDIYKNLKAIIMLLNCSRKFICFR